MMLPLLSLYMYMILAWLSTVQDWPLDAFLACVCVGWSFKKGFCVFLLAYRLALCSFRGIQYGRQIEGALMRVVVGSKVCL